MYFVSELYAGVVVAPGCMNESRTEVVSDSLHVNVALVLCTDIIFSWYML